MPQYERIARAYANSGRLLNPLSRVAYEWLVAMMPTWARKLVLDLAAGAGDSAKFLADEGASVYGLDASREMIDIARARRLRSTLGIQCRFAVHDCRVAVPAVSRYFPELMPSTHFDIVTAVYLLNYAETYADLVGMARMAHLNLREGAPFIAVTEHPEYPVLHHPKKQERFEWLDAEMQDGAQVRLTLQNADGVDTVSFVFRHWSRDTVNAALQEGGFSNVRWHEFGVPLYKAVGAPLSSRATKRASGSWRTKAKRAAAMQPACLFRRVRCGPREALGSTCVSLPRTVYRMLYSPYARAARAHHRPRESVHPRHCAHPARAWGAERGTFARKDKDMSRTHARVNLAPRYRASVFRRNPQAASNGGVGVERATNLTGCHRSSTLKSRRICRGAKEWQSLSTGTKFCCALTMKATGWLS